MHQSRHLEETERTKFRRTKEEEFSKGDNKKKKYRQKRVMATSSGFDMWGDTDDNDERV